MSVDAPMPMAASPNAPAVGPHAVDELAWALGIDIGIPKFESSQLTLSVSPQ